MEQPITDDTAMAAKKKLPTLSFSSNRRFGIELEINAFDGRNRPESGKKVAGIDAVCKMVGKYCSTGAEVRDYEHTQGTSPEERAKNCDGRQVRYPAGTATYIIPCPPPQ
jgi:hypothetical protein